MLGTVVNILQP